MPDIMSKNAIYSPNTNVHPSFANIFKLQRNRRLTRSVMMANAQGYRDHHPKLPINVSNDPLRRDPRYIIQAARVESSIMGRDRGRMRPAAPEQVMWKYPYWSVQRPPYSQPIGPFVQGGLERQSILYRVSAFLQQMSTGG